jgi:hypothetical protein
MLVTMVQQLHAVNYGEDQLGFFKSLFVTEVKGHELAANAWLKLKMGKYVFGA